MTIEIILQTTETIRLLPEEAIKTIQDLLFNPEKDTPSREEMLELYGKMMFHAINLAESKLIDTNKRVAQYKKMFHLWAPHVKALRRKP